MPDAKPLLTIAVPTYNRANCLVELLTYLAPQLQGTTEVQLLISDNASTDSTATVVQSFVHGGLALTYVRNSSNLGMDGNFLQCFEKASGKYVWIVGDDDVLVPGGLQKVLTSLATADFDLIYIRSYSFKGNYRPLAGRRIPPPETVGMALQFVQKVNVALTFLSGNIVNKDRLQSIDHPLFSSLDGSKLVQLAWTYTLLRHFRSGLIIHEPLIAARADNTGGYAVFKVFGVSLRQITQEWLVEPKMVRVMLCSTIHSFLPWFLLTMKSRENTFEPEDAHVVLKTAYGDHPQYWLVDYPIIKLPRRLAKLWYFLGRALLWMDKCIGSPIFG